jgi:hypothetical protein
MLNPQTGAIVWHGSPHKFDKFDASKIGTGEGAQAYGHGLYLADHPETAMSYQPRDPKFEQNIMAAYTRAEAAGQYPSMEVHEAYLLHKTPTEVQAMIDGMEGVSAAEKSAALRAHKFAQQQYAKQSAGALYKVDLPDEQIAKMLDWDKPLSQQAPEVKSLLGQYSKGDVNVSPIVNDLQLTVANDYKLSQNSKHIERFLQKYAANPKDQTVRRQLNYYFRDYPYDREAFKTPMDALEAQWAIPTGDSLKAAQQVIGAGKLEKQLSGMGIPGIRYLDGGSRGAGQGTSNYVVFPGNENLLKILERNGLPIGKP